MTPSEAYGHAHVAQGPFYHPKDAMYHNRDISGAWTTFVLDKSEGFTQVGVGRLNDSILGAQAQMRSNIPKTGTGCDAQKQFLADIEDAIASPVDIPSSISRYQKTLQYASTPLDFVFGIGLYLSPSDMALHPGNIQGYNNEIQPDRKRLSVHKGPQPSQNKTRVSAADSTARQRRNGRARRSTKKKTTALVAVGVAGGLAALCLSSR